MEYALEVIAGILIVGAAGYFFYKQIWPKLSRKIDDELDDLK